jgi:prophage antirepressor-like protein
MKYSSLLIEFYDNILSINKNPIIVLFGEDNTIWFSYNDILTLLGYSNLKLQKNRLALDKKYFDKYENIYKIAKVKQGIEIQNGIQPHLKMINESGLYVLLSRSNKQIAKNISEQLFSDVLPELRKNGKFVLTNPDKVKMNKLTKKLKLYQSEINRTKKQSYKPNITGKGLLLVAHKLDISLYFMPILYCFLFITITKYIL